MASDRGSHLRHTSCPATRPGMCAAHPRWETLLAAGIANSTLHNVLPLSTLRATMAIVAIAMAIVPIVPPSPHGHGGKKHMTCT